MKITNKQIKDAMRKDPRLAPLADKISSAQLKQIKAEFAPKKPRKYLHQPHPDVAPVEFSERPFKAGGITIKPKWAMSADYRQEVQRQYRAHSKPFPSKHLTA